MQDNNLALCIALTSKGCTGAGVRALNRWLAQHEGNGQEHTEAGAGAEHFLTLALPHMPTSMTFKRTDLLNCVRHGFRKDADKIQAMTPEQQELVRETLSIRCVGLETGSDEPVHEPVYKVLYTLLTLLEDRTLTA